MQMPQIVSITSQGQITIPASMRRDLDLNRYKKASVRSDGNKIVIEPIPDLLSLAGIFKNRAIKGKTIRQIIEIEKEAVRKR